MPKRRQVLSDLLAGAVIFAAVAALGLSRGQSIARVLCDGAFVAAAALLGVGGLTLARNKGTFDVAGFGLRTVLQTALPFLYASEKETLMDYRERKALERKSPNALFVSGGIYLALSLVFLLVYSITG